MKIGLVLAANIKLSPYIEIFRKILDSNGVDYEIISWDRESLGEDDGIVFNYPASNTRSLLGKFLDYCKFAKFVKNIVLKTRYDKLIVFGGALGVFMYPFLKQYYNGCFWLDYRDLSIEQKFMKRFKKLCDISADISISSPGFKKVFPFQYDFIISHNFDIDYVRSAITDTSKLKLINNPIVVSTIGQIRDYDANVQVIRGLQNKDDFVLNFVGKGIASKMLMKYAHNTRTSNINFHGYYPKEMEGYFYQQADFINIFQSNVTGEMTLMSNRFYLALIYHKPMIVTKFSTQGEYVDRYKLGLSITGCSDLSFKINDYINSFDNEAFVESCNRLLCEFISDYDNFYVKLLKFVSR